MATREAGRGESRQGTIAQRNRTEFQSRQLRVEKRPFFFLIRRPPPNSTLFPYTTLFRSSLSTGLNVVPKPPTSNFAKRVNISIQINNIIININTLINMLPLFFVSLSFFLEFALLFLGEIGRAHV